MSIQLTKNTKTVTLNTGATIPQIGLGTWQAKHGNEAYDSVLAALKSGYRHIDTAAKYDNEVQVGKAIRDSGVPREEVFVTTKLWCTQQQEVSKALDESLERLGLDYVDAYLMHWPVCLRQDTIKDGNLMVIPILPSGKRDVNIDTWNFVKTWELMQDLPKDKVRSIGVSNFSINNIKDLLKSPGNTTVPVMNQVEMHPLLPQEELLQWCHSKGIYLEAYSPLGSTNAPILSEQEIIDIAKRNDVTPAQVVISWHVQRGYVVLPKSITPARIESNLFTFTLPQEDFETISKLSSIKGEMRNSKPDWDPFVPFI